MKTAQQAAEKYVSRASVAGGDYVEGARSPKRSQSQAAIAAAEITKQATMAALNEGRREAGLRKSGDQGWLAGVTGKGANRYGEGVAAGKDKYVTESSRFDSARGAASSLPRGLKGSETNYARSKAVGTALRAVKGSKA